MLTPRVSSGSYHIEFQADFDNRSVAVFSFRTWKKYLLFQCASDFGVRYFHSAVKTIPRSLTCLAYIILYLRFVTSIFGCFFLLITTFFLL